MAMPHLTREEGQTFTETAMILGLVSAIIVSLTQIVYPLVMYVVKEVATHQATYVTTPRNH